MARFFKSLNILSLDSSISGFDFKFTTILGVARYIHSFLRVRIRIGGESLGFLSILKKFRENACDWWWKLVVADPFRSFAFESLSRPSGSLHGKLNDATCSLCRDLLSLSWVSKLLDSFLRCHESFQLMNDDDMNWWWTDFFLIFGWWTDEWWWWWYELMMN